MSLQCVLRVECLVARLAVEDHSLLRGVLPLYGSFNALERFNSDRGLTLHTTLRVVTVKIRLEVRSLGLNCAK